MPADSIDNRAIKIHPQDNVATALNHLTAGRARIVGEKQIQYSTVLEPVQAGHKIALCDLSEDAPVLKFGAPIGWATRPIQAGEWVHLHNCRSALDERSSSLDVQTGAPSDTLYE